jgi:N-acetylmuramoyl-L-alanine amidase
VFPRQGRGLRNAPVPVLEGLTIPAVIIELGFATNIKDRKKLASRKIQQSIAKALSRSIKEYFHTEG